MSPLALLVAQLLAAPASAAERPAGFDEQIREFEKNTGIDLHVVGDSSEPPMQIGDNLAPVDPFLAARALPLIEDVLMHYPTTVRGVLLTDMYLFGKLQMAGKPFLGAARPEKLRFDLAIRPRTSDAGMKTTLYHEMSHLIEFDEEFPAEEWVALSKPYLGRLDKLPETKSRDAESWWRDGFVTRYASKSRHEDFAELAELAFTNPARVNELADQYPLLDKKLDMLTDVYEDYAPGMTLPWAPTRNRVSASTEVPRPTAPPAAEPKPEAPAEPAPSETAPRRGKPARALDDNGNPIRTGG